MAPVSRMSGSSFWTLRAARATFTPSPARRRASDALIPGPAPTINALRYGKSGMVFFLLSAWPMYPGHPGHRMNWVHLALHLPRLFHENQQAIVRRQIMIGVQSQTILSSQRGYRLNVAQSGLRIALLQHLIEFLVAVRCVPTVVAKRSVYTHHSARRQHAPEPLVQSKHLGPGHDVQCVGGEHGTDAAQRPYRLAHVEQRRRT